MIFTAEILLSNSINAPLYILFLLIYYTVLLLQPLKEVLLVIDPSNSVILFYQDRIMVFHKETNISLNGISISLGILIVINLISIRKGMDF